MGYPRIKIFFFPLFKYCPEVSVKNDLQVTAKLNEVQGDVSFLII